MIPRLSVSDITHPLLNLYSLFTLHRRLVSPPVSHLYRAQKVWHVVCSRLSAPSSWYRDSKKANTPPRAKMTFCHTSDFKFRNNRGSHDKTSHTSIINQTNYIHFAQQCLTTQPAWLLLCRVTLMWWEEEVGYLQSKQQLRQLRIFQGELHEMKSSVIVQNQHWYFNYTETDCRCCSACDNTAQLRFSPFMCNSVMTFH